MKRAVQRYQAAQSTNRANQGRLVVLMYEGAIRALREAAASFAGRRNDEARERLARAERIVRELAGALDLTGGDALALALDEVYADCTRRLAAASVARDAGAVSEVAAILDQLAGAWRQAAQQVTPSFTSV